MLNGNSSTGWSSTWGRFTWDNTQTNTCQDIANASQASFLYIKNTQLVSKFPVKNLKTEISIINECVQLQGRLCTCFFKQSDWLVSGLLNDISPFSVSGGTEHLSKFRI